MTKAQLRRMILTHLRVIDPEDSPSAGQASQLDLWLDSARAALLQRGICWWDEDDVPAEVCVPFTKYVAAQCCSAFGKAGKGFEASEIPAANEIAALKSSEQRPTTRADYF